MAVASSNAAGALAEADAVANRLSALRVMPEQGKLMVQVEQVPAARGA